MTHINSVDSELVIQDRVLVEADVDGRAIALRAMIVKVCPDELWLGMASPDRRLEAFAQDQVLDLTVARTGAALVGQSGFLRPLGGSKSRIFAVVRPASLERVQRRTHLRYQIDLPIIFRHTDPETREPRGKAGAAKTINVSPGGLLFQGEIPATLGEELALTLPITREDHISMLGVVTRIRGGDEAAPEENSPAGAIRTEVALRFTRLTAVDQERLIRFVLLTEHRRREAALREPQQVTPAPPIAVAPPALLRPASAPVPVAAPATAPATAPRPAPSRPAEPAEPAEPAGTDADRPLIAVGLQLCEAGRPQEVRGWFDGLVPGSRIELLSMLQANMAGGSVPGAAEPASVRPLAVALGLLAA